MKLKYLWIAFAVFLLITIPFRVYQVVALIDPKTNFYVKGTEFTLGLLIGLLALYTIGVLVLTAWRKDTVRHTVHKNVPAGIFAAVAGLLMLTESASELVSAVTNEGQRVEASVLSATALLAAIAFVIMAISSFVGRNLFERVPLLALLTTLWGCARLVITFLGYTNIASDSSSMFDMVGIIFALLFLFTQAKLFANVDSKNTSKRLFIGVFNIPELVQYIIGTLPLTIDTFLPRIIDLSLACYIFCILLEMSKEYFLSGAEQKVGIEDYSDLADKPE